MFARPGSLTSFKGSTLLAEFKKQIDLQNPKHLTCTGLRHHAATLMQVQEKDENLVAMEDIAQHLGHDLAVHKNNYRLPLQVVQRGKVGNKLLSLVRGDFFGENNGSTLLTLDSHGTKGQNENNNEMHDIGDNELAVTHTEVTKELDSHGTEMHDISDYELEVTLTEVTKELDSHETKGQNENNDEIHQISKSKLMASHTEVTKELSMTGDEDKNNHLGSEYEFSSDESDESYHEIVKKKTKKSKISRTRWTDQENEIVFRYFKTHIQQKINPKTYEILELKKKYPQLNRTVNVIRTKINNYIKNKQKLPLHLAS